MNNKKPSGMSYGFHHLALRVRDIEKSVDFYTQVLGFKEVMRFPHPWDKGIKQISMLDTGDGNYLEIFSDAPASTRPDGAFFHVAFRVDDVDALYERVKASGARVAREPGNVLLGGESPSTLRVVFFNGPDGEELEFCQQLEGLKL